MDMTDKIKLGFLIYTYDRVDDVRINMEIIESRWKSAGLFSDVKMVHAYNGQERWYPEKYLEDDLIRMGNPGHFRGASELIDAGMGVMREKYGDRDYVIVVASDTWLVSPEKTYRLIERMARENLLLATCPWGLPERADIRDVGVAVDYFILDSKWAAEYSLFPLAYREFYEKFGELMLYQNASNVMLEKLFLMRYLQAVRRMDPRDNEFRLTALSKMLMMKDREPVHSHRDERGMWVRTHYWESLGLLTHHESGPKKELLRSLGLMEGKYVRKFLKSGDLSYFNAVR